jgi:hypothetical protein
LVWYAGLPVGQRPSLSPFFLSQIGQRLICMQVCRPPRQPGINQICRLMLLNAKLSRSSP